MNHMKNLYDFLYISYYFLVVKKPNDESHIRALFLQSITLNNLLINILFYCYLFLNLKHVINPKLLFLLVMIYVLSAYLGNKYYIDTGKYKECIEKYNSKNLSKSTRIAMAFLAVLLFLFSFLLFMIIGVKVSRQ